MDLSSVQSWYNNEMNVKQSKPFQALIYASEIMSCVNRQAGLNENKKYKD